VVLAGADGEHGDVIVAARTRQEREGLRRAEHVAFEDQPAFPLVRASP
jgi:hypothetical protein